MDHPRSRGVYLSGPLPFNPAVGSSPLARGLRDPVVLGGGAVGIIPARAGFTAPPGGCARPAGDHPRSRGVYRGGAVAAGGGRGSSPLARGLQPLVGREPDDERIIPARAGFTSWRTGAARWSWDHPRSRGVYSAPPMVTPTMPGSSPLARGLPRPPSGGGRSAGIIPARAGFTAGGEGVGLGHRDHPRSRGVYCVPRRGPQPTGGSSPLARGLHGTPKTVLGRERIIPARAGFTGGVRRHARRRRDHPRSRGVYGSAPGAAGVQLGSSPLARGLRDLCRRRRRDRRIIPARAGFTREAPPVARSTTDHPRSRGVYSGRLRLPITDHGSSPLARGLPNGERPIRPGGRIIPARAGFTLTSAESLYQAGDHPRSRGVY